ncbi:MAG: aminodeoxychorismate/anthranilate synthase component II [Simkaniaceae bacterium]|nr:aminodeoxychorismate/anthranilate synthase component II [Simkaniaceae bacterium]
MIVIIDNYDSFTYNLYQMLSHVEVRVIRNDALTPSEVLALQPAGIIISPGPKSPKEAGISISLIQLAYDKIPILGVCLGHQAIAEAFQGKVIRAPSPVHGKRGQVFHKERGLFKGMPLPFEAGRYHSLIVEKSSLPSVLQIEAENEEGLIMALKHVDHPCYGVQFHPESILTQDGGKLIEAFLKECYGS